MPGIWKCEDGGFLVRVRFRDPKTGKRIERTGRAETWVKATGMLGHLAHQTDRQAPPRQRFGDYAVYFLEQWSSGKKASSRRAYAYSLQVLVKTFYAHWVDAIDARDVLRWQSASVKAGQNATTVNNHHRVLKVALDRAKTEGLVTRNVAREVPSLKERRAQGRRGRSLTLPELRRFIEAAHALQGNGVREDVARLTLCLAWTGMRQGEARALRWTDIAQDGELRIERSVYRRSEGTTKTDDPRRVWISEPLGEVFDA